MQSNFFFCHSITSLHYELGEGVQGQQYFTIYRVKEIKIGGNKC
nr:MAG TPA: hypothetical protein [Caudoviricetes sp.]